MQKSALMTGRSATEGVPVRRRRGSENVFKSEFSFRRSLRPPGLHGSDSPPGRAWRPSKPQPNEHDVAGNFGFSTQDNFAESAQYGAECAVTQ